MKLLVTKIVSVVVLFAFILMLMWTNEPKDVSEGDMRAMISSGDYLDGSNESGTMRFKRAYGLNSDDYEYMVYYEPDSNMDVTEIMILKLKDESQRETAVLAAEQRLGTQKKNFDGYGEDQTEILSKAVIYSAGKYVCFFAGKGSADMLAAFKKIVEV